MGFVVDNVTVKQVFYILLTSTSLSCCLQPHRAVNWLSTVKNERKTEWRCISGKSPRGRGLTWRPSPEALSISCQVVGRSHDPPDPGAVRLVLRAFTMDTDKWVLVITSELFVLVHSLERRVLKWKVIVGQNSLFSIGLGATALGVNIQGGPRVGIQYIVYTYMLCTYFWSTLYVRVQQIKK